jgi:hypothetical protein
VSGEKKIRFVQTIASFSKTQGKAKENKGFFKEIVALIEKNKEALPKEIKIKKGTVRFILDSDDYMITLMGGKCFEVRWLINKPETNIETVNKLANTIISCVNAVLKEKADASSIFISEIFTQDKKINLASKIVGSAQLAKANEVTKETLTPFAIALEYNKDSRKYVISSVYSQTSSSYPIQNSISVQFKLEEPIPFDMLQKQYENLNYSVKLCEKLVESEL